MDKKLRWNELTAKELLDACEATEGVCLLPMGVIERHGDHLPTGIDYMKGWHYADLAAEREPAVVFPHYYTGNVSGCAYAPGTIAFPLHLCVDHLTHLCCEISRNGFKKIILVNAHGGNILMIDYFLNVLCEKEHDFTVYAPWLHFGDRTVAAIQKMRDETGSEDGHGGGYETAVALHLFPHCVKMADLLPRESGQANPRSQSLEELQVKTSVWWYSQFPNHLAGYGGDVEVRHGEEICSAIAEDLADIIRAVKKDDVTPELMRRFYAMKKNPRL
jgi:creatinine amidohydrolase